MNIYLFELKNQWKNTAGWIIIFSVLMFVLCMGIYPIFNNSLQDIVAVISKMPAEFTKAFSFDLNSMVDFGGYYEFIFAYFSLMGAIMASSISLSIFAREKRVKCIDFLLTKPISRQWVFTTKFLSGLTLIVVFNIVYMILSCIFGTYFGKSFEEMILASSMMFLTQFFYYNLGIVVAIFSKKIRSVSNTASVLGFIGFILSALYNILEIEGMRFLAPLKYFDPIQFFTTTSNEYMYILTGIFLLILFLFVSYAKFNQEDVKAV